MLMCYHRCHRRYGNLPLLQTLDSTHRSLDRWRAGKYSPFPLLPLFFLPHLQFFHSSFTIANSHIKQQFAESQLGISLIPYGRLQRYFTSIDLRSAMQDNVAFKLAFGATFALTGFAQL
jgi:hypothetical protein